MYGYVLLDCCICYILYYDCYFRGYSFWEIIRLLFLFFDFDIECICIYWYISFGCDIISCWVEGEEVLVVYVVFILVVFVIVVFVISFINDFIGKFVVVCVYNDG